MLYRLAQIGLARHAVFALAAFGHVERNHVIALLQALHARPDVDHDARAFVAENGREQAFRIGAGERELVGMADAGRLDLDQDLARFRSIEIDRFDRERCTCLVCDGGFDFHCCLPGEKWK